MVLAQRPESDDVWWEKVCSTSTTDACTVAMYGDISPFRRETLSRSWGRCLIKPLYLVHFQKSAHNSAERNAPVHDFCFIRGRERPVVKPPEYRFERCLVELRNEFQEYLNTGIFDNGDILIN
jgi:hypothetical protein